MIQDFIPLTSNVDELNQYPKDEKENEIYESLEVNDDVFETLLSTNSQTSSSNSTQGVK